MIFFLLLGVLLVSVLWELFYKFQWSKRVTVRLWFEHSAVYAGSDTKLYEVIENRKNMPVPVLEVGFHAKRELDFADTENTNVSDYIYKRDVFSVLGSQKITREISVKCTKRGKYAIHDVEITTYTLLHRKHYNKSIETAAEIYVYPKMTDVSEIMTLCERMLGTIQCTKKLYEDPFAFRTIRNYTTDDPMKTINWKASAKTGELMVNTYDSAQSQKAMIFLDVEDTGILKREDLVEDSIAMAATVVRKLLRQNTEVGFVYNGGCEGDGWFMMPTNSKSARTGLERTLAEYNCEHISVDFVQLVEEIFTDKFAKNPLSQDTLLIFITKNLNIRIMEGIRACIGAYQTLIVVPVLRGEKGAKEREMEKALITNRDNIRIVIKEVERG